MRYLHTMLRVRNLDDALDFYCNKLGLQGSLSTGGSQEPLHPGISAGPARTTKGSSSARAAAATRR